ncbi:ferritin-like domain-containing protein [Polyangium sorediatum]|uniref:Ferritin-like domain-containing protein n=1 Tax=Polyangium sorediatum TaxID=889274 RepID=A0ABT6P6F4_9BACT|nr:ferritin-like domain-containing protein [Polyangium sorediatum]MDI1436206.1 ferritin-like domain-containing protein [Polyangium sorediatum]
MDRYRSLRLSLLVAIGGAACSASPPASSGAGEGAVVAIPTTPSSATAEPSPEGEPEPERPKRVGWVAEKNGNVHRASRVTCDATIDIPACAGTEMRQSCKTDADCTEHPHGKCTSGVGQVGTYCGCTYACETDDECGAGKACICKGTGALRARNSVCGEASCSTDADCGGSTCGLSAYHNGCFEQVTLACRTKEDTCKSDADCGSSPRPGGSCVAIGAKGAKPTWQCASMSCVIGRPLVVEGEARAARPRARADWRAPLVFDTENLDAGVREAIAAHHAAIAAMEHASIASFARFSLQLLALGAPADLLAEAQTAARDEVEHARIEYAIASRIGGRLTGPDKLPEATAWLATDVVSFVESLVVEGCVGETLGAAEGQEVARFVKDEGLRAVLAQIAEDEARHAALAWKTLQWALDAFGAEAREAAVRAFERARAKHEKDPAAGPVENEEFGVLGARTLGTLRREALREVVAPCFRQLGLVACS